MPLMTLDQLLAEMLSPYGFTRLKRDRHWYVMLGRLVA